jgi:hypothetical protein
MRREDPNFYGVILMKFATFFQKMKFKKSDFETSFNFLKTTERLNIPVSARGLKRVILYPERFETGTLK